MKIKKCWKNITRVQMSQVWAQVIKVCVAIVRCADRASLACLFMWCPKGLLVLRGINLAQLWPNKALWTDMTDLKLATLAIEGAQEFRVCVEWGFTSCLAVKVC